MADIEWTVKELTRLITLVTKGLGKKPNRSDTKLLFKLEINADQIKKDEEFEKSLSENGD